MSELTNEQVIQNLLEAYAKGDPAAMFSLIAEDAVMVMGEAPSSALPWLGTHRGHAEIAAALTTLATVLETTVYEVREVFGQGDKFAALTHEEFVVRSNGKSFATNPAHIFTVKNGKVIRAEIFDDTALIANMLAS